MELGISEEILPLGMPASLPPRRPLPKVWNNRPPSGEAAGGDSSRAVSPGPPRPAPAASFSAGTRCWDESWVSPLRGAALPGRGRAPNSVSPSQTLPWKQET